MCAQSQALAQTTPLAFDRLHLQAVTCYNSGTCADQASHPCHTDVGCVVTRLYDYSQSVVWLFVPGYTAKYCVVHSAQICVSMLLGPLTFTTLLAILAALSCNYTGKC